MSGDAGEGAAERERRAFVEAHTARQRPPGVPEIELHLASEITPLWHSTAESLEARGVEPPYWAFAWAGGQALARYFLDRPECVRGKAVADFGAGSGLVAIAAMKAGAARAMAIDLDPLALTACQLNAESNGVVVETMCKDGADDELPAWDVVAIGDVFYESGPAARIAAWARRLARAGKLVLVGDPGRAYLPGDLEELSAMVLETSVDLESLPSKRVGVYRVADR